MQTKQNLNAIGGRSIYLKPVNLDDLPADVRDAADAHDTLFAVHNADGEQVALVASRAVASHLAEANDMMLVPLH